MTLSTDQRRRIRDVATAARPGTGAWDSLDVLEVLVLVEDATGLTLADGSFAPGDLVNPDAVVEAFEREAIPSPRSFRLHAGARGGETISDVRRRRMEYALNLSFPTSRIGVTGRGDIVALSEELAGLPLAPGLLRAFAPHDVEPGPIGERTAEVDHRCAGADAGDVFETIGAAVRGRVRELGGECWPPSGSLVALDRLEALGYLEGNGEQVVSVSDSVALLPAGCLASYEALFDGYDGVPLLVTFLARVFRREPAQLDPFGRFPSFSVQEVVWLGPPGWCDETAQRISALIDDVANLIGIGIEWVDAHDPFFRGEGAGPGTKREAVTTADGRRLAIASVNQHDRHFVDAVGCDRDDLVSGCAGLGLDRWLLAVEHARG